MSAREDREIGLYFDRLAREGLFDVFTSEQEKVLAGLLQRWCLRAGQFVLEPGAGTGRLTAVLSREVGPAGRVLAFDLSGEMVRKLSAGFHFPPVCRVVASALAVPCAGRVADHVICLNVFPHFTHREEVLRELHRTLRPGGNLWICHLDSRETVNARHQAVAGHIAGHLLPPAVELADLVGMAGFHVRDCCDTGREYWLHAVRPDRA